MKIRDIIINSIIGAVTFGGIIFASLYNTFAPRGSLSSFLSR
jgi:hypothetical protein